VCDRADTFGIYLAGVSLHGTMQYDLGLVGISVLIAIVTCAAALTAGLRVRGLGSTLGVSMIMGVAVTGMHYTGMDAMHVYAGSGRAMSGEPSSSLLLPLLLGTSVVTFLLMLIIAVSPNEDEIRADASLSRRLRAGGSLAVRDSLRPAETTQSDVFAQGDVFRTSG